LKMKFLNGQSECLLHVETAQWKKLTQYWSTDLQREKSTKMASARWQMKNSSCVGRKEKAGKEAKLVCP
jgi:hypothetical protein